MPRKLRFRRRHDRTAAAARAASAARAPARSGWRRSIEVASSPPILAEGRLNEGSHLFHLTPGLARDEHEGAVADAPDRRLMAEYFHELARSRRVRQHEERHRPALMPVHDVRDLPFAVQTRARADELEPRTRGLIGQMHLPAEAGDHRALDGTRRVVRIEHAIHRETFH